MPRSLRIYLPVRFADAVGGGAKEQGVFKRVRGILRGWELPEDEDERAGSLADREVALQRGPTKSCIEAPAGTRLTP